MMKGVNRLFRAGRLEPGAAAEVRFPARGGIVQVRVGSCFVALGVVEEAVLGPFLTNARRKLRRAGHPPRLVCIFTPTN